LKSLPFVIPQHGLCARNLLSLVHTAKLSANSGFLLFATLIVGMTKQGVFIQTAPPRRFAPRSLQLHPRHLTRAALRVLNKDVQENSRKISVRRENFRATMRHCSSLEILIHTAVARYKKRIPQYT
jgi:hypothetical protein